MKTPGRHIRDDILGITTREMAEILGVSIRQAFRVISAEQVPPTAWPALIDEFERRRIAVDLSVFRQAPADAGQSAAA